MITAEQLAHGTMAGAMSIRCFAEWWPPDPHVYGIVLERIKVGMWRLSFHAWPAFVCAYIGRKDLIKELFA